MGSKRPEHQAPPEVYYNEDEARKYSQNTHIIDIQTRLSERAIELLNLPDEEPCMILDIGCGSGLSGEVLTDLGHSWIGLDISPAMLDVAQEREVEGDLVNGDIGYGMPFRAGSFDGAISISALQWLCNADKNFHNPVKRLYKFFSTLYACLNRGARAVFQFYPETSHQVDMITQQAMKAGFTGGLVIDYPNSTKAKKMFLCLFSGGSVQQLPKGLTGEEGNEEQSHARFDKARQRYKDLKGKSLKKSRTWILEKKERWRNQGRDVRPNSRYTGRKRPQPF
ncbi:unnamed protein product [Didymodactylos carnosus]|uniref:18S rRNA (guanine-N(7))-methyltransferase n=1 Tax=Didymodactylos carnosus TaxID=1234261 RepID=A0A814BP44_9BILA|nr:unnamed protein product [Didymodactylos carnosus]CAF0995508.1 unnamed protein product [Didymodactylos carnosus]CAF3709243.1 unnamed protein product [Didymodactylos carnosus]CAF3765227.1 unnamed protein product [Didymodactylos carnosus]